MTSICINAVWPVSFLSILKLKEISYLQHQILYAQILYFATLMQLLICKQASDIKKPNVCIIQCKLQIFI